MASDARLGNKLGLASGVCSAFVGVLGLAVLVGWVLDIDLLERTHPPLGSMKPLSALAFAMSAGALWLQREPGRAGRTGRALGWAVALLGLVTVVEYVTGHEIGIERLLFGDAVRLESTLTPGRMSPVTAVHFILLGLAAALLDARAGRAHRPAEWLALAVALASLLALLGYLLGARSLYAVGSYPSIALHTTIGFLVAAAAVLLARPDHGLMRLITSATPGGHLARRMLPAALLVPAVLGLLRLRALRSGAVGFELGLALFCAANIVCFTGLVLWNARALAQLDESRRRAEDAVRASEESLAITLDSIGEAVVSTDADGRVGRMNPVAEALTGWREAEATGRDCDEVLRIVKADTRESLPSPVGRALRGDVVARPIERALLVARDGGEHAITGSSAPIRDASGVLRGAVVVLRDRAPEERAEQVLRESEARKAAVLEASLDCIVTMDHTGAIVELNGAAERDFGFTRAAAIGRQLGDLMIPVALRERHRLGVERYLADGQSRILGRRIELSALRADGSVFPAELTVSRIHSTGPPMFTGTIRDITERQRAAEALQASESRFRRLFESGLIGIVVADSSGVICDANDAFLRMVGSSRDALTAGLLDWGELAPPTGPGTDRPAHPPPGEQPVERELHCRDGGRVPVLLGVTQLDETSTIAFALDLRERRRAEAAIASLRRERASDAKFRALLEAAADATIITDRYGIVMLVNGRTEVMFGFPREEILGQPAGRLVRGAAPDGARGELGSTVELVGRRKDGSDFLIEVSVSPIETEDGLLVSNSIRDITQRKEAEAVLRRARDEAEIAIGELEAFSYSVAHDLRTPLRAINGFSSALLEDWGERLDDEAREYLSRIRGGASNMGQLIDALLTLSGVSRVGLLREPVDLTQLAKEVAAQLSGGEPGRRVDFAIEDGLEQMGDPQLLRVVLENLLGNSWKFTSRQKASHIQFGSAPGEAAVYYVRDDGAGFDMKYADKLFTPFQRLHQPGEFSGTGIGLATVHRIVRRHGGRIWAEAAEDRGATFWFTLSG
ncbi:MAG TPA: PAS domain S-box protein [Kofleriaceae bacterium]|nr:PAS domain S-box protein [Kofleriaceae bacterium]